MEEKLLKKGIKYIVKVGRNSIPVRLVQKNADGVSYLVKNLKILKPFFVRSEKSFVDFQNDIERQKALKIIEKENAQIAFPKDSKVPNEPEIAKISNSSKVHNNPKTPQVSKLSNEEDVTKISNDSKLTKTSKISNEGKFSKNPKIMGFRKCAFVRALGRLGYNYEQAKKILAYFGVEMPEKSVRVQLCFGKNEKFWEKFGKPAELSEDKLKHII